MPAQPKRASITLNGETCKVKSGTAKFTPGGLSGTEVTNDDGTVETVYENKPCMLEWTLPLSPGHNFSTLKGLQDAEGTFTWLDTGESWALTGMTASEGGTWVQDGDGAPVKFHGNPANPG
jgi:hypothetical protein